MQYSNNGLFTLNVNLQEIRDRDCVCCYFEKHALMYCKRALW